MSGVLIKFLKQMGNNKTKYLFNILSAFFAFLLWGSWAYFINQNIKSALVQGLASFIITIFLIKCVTKIFNFLVLSKARFFLPTAATILITTSSLTAIHFLVGTKNIFYTIAPPVSVATIFCFFVTAKLEKINHDKSK